MAARGAPRLNILESGERILRVFMEPGIRGAYSEPSPSRPRKIRLSHSGVVLIPLLGDWVNTLAKSEFRTPEVQDAVAARYTTRGKPGKPGS